MSKAKKLQKQRFQKEKVHWSIPLTRSNFIIFGIGLILLVIGFYIMTIPPWDSFAALVISPIILVIAYFVVFPLGILKKHSEK
jgi:ABC-type polysaccharide/polyol phosphate export permease